MLDERRLQGEPELGHPRAPVQEPEREENVAEAPLRMAAQDLLERRPRSSGGPREDLGLQGPGRGRAARLPGEESRRPNRIPRKQQVPGPEEGPHQDVAPGAVQEVRRMLRPRDHRVHPVSVEAAQHAVGPPRRVTGPLGEEARSRREMMVRDAGDRGDLAGDRDVAAVGLAEGDRVQIAPDGPARGQEVAGIEPPRERHRDPRQEPAVLAEHLLEPPVEVRRQAAHVSSSPIRECDPVVGRGDHSLTVEGEHQARAHSADLTEQRPLVQDLP